MFLLCRGDLEGWVVEGPGPAPGIWATMETAPRVTTNTDGISAFSARPQRNGKVRKVFLCVCF